MLRKLYLLVVLMATLAVLGIAPTAGGKSIGRCPNGASEKWELVTVASLGISPETANGIPSLDGNGDGWTCIHPVPNHPVEGAFIFRDNTVQG
jgi:hypothetical protein